MQSLNEGIIVDKKRLESQGKSRRDIPRKSYAREEKPIEYNKNIDADENKFEDDDEEEEEWKKW